VRPYLLSGLYRFVNARGATGDGLGSPRLRKGPGVAITQSESYIIIMNQGFNDRHREQMRPKPHIPHGTGWRSQRDLIDQVPADLPAPTGKTDPARPTVGMKNAVGKTGIVDFSHSAH